MTDDYNSRLHLINTKHVVYIETESILVIVVFLDDQK